MVVVYVRNNLYRRGYVMVYLLIIFWLFWACRLQVGKGVIILSGMIQLPTFVRRGSL